MLDADGSRAIMLLVNITFVNVRSEDEEMERIFFLFSFSPPQYMNYRIASCGSSCAFSDALQLYYLLPLLLIMLYLL